VHANPFDKFLLGAFTIIGEKGLEKPTCTAIKNKAITFLIT